MTSARGWRARAVEQATKPQTFGYGLTDSPAGQLAWIVEKFKTWSDCGGDLEKSFTKDELLDNVMVYWLNAAATSSARLYWHSLASSLASFDEVPAPAAYSRFPCRVRRRSARGAPRSRMSV
jgi:hypothetical protein